MEEKVSIKQNIINLLYKDNCYISSRKNGFLEKGLSVSEELWKPSSTPKKKGMITIAKQKKILLYKGDVTSEIEGLAEFTV